jgi:hypothetical protein
MKPTNAQHIRLAVCLDNTGSAASLEPRKLYRVLPDPSAKALDQLRVVDESGEDYLYPASLFVTGIRMPWAKVPARRVALFAQRATMSGGPRGGRGVKN